MSKSTKEETAIAVKEAGALSTDLMGELGEMMQSAGPLIQVRQSVIKTPRIKLANDMSKARKSKLAEEGDFFCEAKTKNYGKQITIIPIIISESASLMNAEGKVLCRSADLVRNHHGVMCSTCPEFGQYWNDWGTKEAPKVPQCKTSFDVLCIPYGTDEVVEMNFRKMNSKAGRELINMIANSKNKVPFASCYTFKSVPGVSGIHNYFKISEDVKRSELAEDELRLILPAVKSLLEAKKHGNIEREEETGDDLPI